MNSWTISDIRNITINNLWLNKRRDKRRHNLLFTQNSLVKIFSSCLKLRKSLRVKISREEDSRVAQFATYRPIWQPWIQAKPWYCQLERGFPKISWPRLVYLTQNIGQLSAVHKVSYHFWRHTSFSPKLLKIRPLSIRTFFISITWQINSVNEWYSLWITCYIWLFQ